MENRDGKSPNVLLVRIGLFLEREEEGGGKREERRKEEEDVELELEVAFVRRSFSFLFLISARRGQIFHACLRPRYGLQEMRGSIIFPFGTAKRENEGRRRVRASLLSFDASLYPSRSSCSLSRRRKQLVSFTSHSSPTPTSSSPLSSTPKPNPTPIQKRNASHQSIPTLFLLLLPLSLLLHIILTILSITLHSNQPLPTLLRLPEFPSSLPQPSSESLSSSSVGREIPDLELGFGSGGGEGERSVGGEGEGEDSALEEGERGRRGSQ